MKGGSRLSYRKELRHPIENKEVEDIFIFNGETYQAFLRMLEAKILTSWQQNGGLLWRNLSGSRQKDYNN